jgi:hypothetical protein
VETEPHSYACIPDDKANVPETYALASIYPMLDPTPELALLFTRLTAVSETGNGVSVFGDDTPGIGPGWGVQHG